MKRLAILSALSAALTFAACNDNPVNEGRSIQGAQLTYSSGLNSPDSFATIKDESQRSQALFAEMFKVIDHPRCMNCHPVEGGSILQGDKGELHMPMVTRGGDDFGADGMKCSTCHGPDNVNYTTKDGSIPGHDPWHVAPLSMGWQGLAIGQICDQLKDTARNGGRSLEEIWEHNAKDGLVGWGWNPGPGRESAPGTQAEFGALTRAWIETGAHCPA